MYGKTKLLLVACSGHDTAQLAKDIHKILKKDFGLEDQVELLLSRKCRDIDKELQKNYRTPAIADYFPDMEVQVDIGRNELKDVIRGKHVALVEHLLTPNRKVSVNDHIMTVRGFFNVINEVETLQRTLIAPYHAYVRSHSVEKYRKSGFFQFDSLRMTMKDFANDGLNTFLTIDTHSKKRCR